MTELGTNISAGLVRQQDIRNRCRHPSGGCAQICDEEIDGSLSIRFERQVGQYADQIAFTDEENSLTYRELNVVANHIAHAIYARLGEGEESVVVLMDNSVSCIAAFLGVLKAGKCHVAVRPDLPRERQKFIVGQSEARMMLVDTQHRELARSLAESHLHIFDVDDIGDAAVENLGLVVPPDRRCWMVYTSGSTGQPKGVVQTHRNVLHDVRTYVDNFHISPRDRLSLLMSLTTNAGSFCALMALINGATLCQIDVQRQGVGHMANEVARQKLTIWGGVPSLFRQWMTCSRMSYPQLRLVWFGGETALTRDLQLYQQHLRPQCVFVNRLGSTETGCTRMYFADHETRISGSTVPVGYPVEGREVMIMDDEGQLVDAPASGEIAVCDRYLSTGYWKQPDLTDAAYTTLSDGVGSRLYRTGDLGRMEADGCLTYLGRKDFQVQVRGFRVEVAEIETVLARLNAVRDSVVIGQALPEGDHRLVAYLIPATKPGPTVSQLRRELADRLPDYMVPSAFVYMDSFPRAANGKVVRNQLPLPGRARPPVDAPWMPPRTPFEHQIVRIWTEVLDLEQVGVEDNFRDLGGDSLRAAQVVARMQEAFGIELSQQIVFKSETVAELAIVLCARLVQQSNDVTKQDIMDSHSDEHTLGTKTPGDPA